MASKYLAYRLGQIGEAIQVLRATIERRVPPDQILDSALDNVEAELSLTLSEANKEK